MCSKTWDSKKIRSTHIEQAINYRNKFKELLKKALLKLDYQSLSAEEILYKNNHLKHWEQRNSTIHTDNLKHFFAND